MDQRIADREEAARVDERARDRAAREADSAASWARAEAAGRAKAAKEQAKLEVAGSDDDVEGDGSYSIADIRAGQVLRQLQADQAEARRVHGPGGNVDED